MNNLKLINVLKEANARVSAVKSFVDKVADGAALAKANKPLFDAFTEVLNFARTDANQIRGVKAGSQNTDNILKTVDELMYALKTPNGMKPETIGLLNQGLLKSKTPPPLNMIDDITKDVVAQDKFIKRYGQLTDKQMKDALLAAGYSDNATNSLMVNAKKNPKFKAQMRKGQEKRKLKKTSGGNEKPMNPKSDTPNIPESQKKTLTARASELLDMIKIKKMSWKQAVAWAAGIGVTAYALWWWLYDNSDDIPSDTPETEPTDTGEWAECIKEIIQSKEGIATSTPGGDPAVVFKNDEYPQGLVFFANGRVFDNTTKKKGSWKCKQGQVTIQEQSSEIDVDTMTQFVDEAVDALDGYVALGNLYTLEGIVKTLQGKTFQGQNALQAFLSLYQEDEGGDKFIDDINNVGVKTLGTKGILAKRNILSILSGGGSSTAPTPTTGEKKGLGNIEIIWDGSSNNDGGAVVTPNRSRYHDCNSKSLPHEFGCRSNQIKELQICLGLPEKYQTGNFGPITKKALEDKGIDPSNGITQFVIDTACGKGEGGIKREPVEPIKTDRLKMSDLVMPKPEMKLPDIKPLEVTPSRFYNSLRQAGLISGEDGGNRIKYKGPDLDETQLGTLDTALDGMGYTRIKQLEDIKRYGSKYVWLKR